MFEGYLHKPRLEKLTLAVREALDSRHNGDPLKPLDTLVI